MVHGLNTTLQQVNAWLLEHGLSISIDKCASILFPKAINHEALPPIILDGKTIELKDNITYLGVLLDYSLNWSKHVIKYLAKAQHATHVIRSLRSTWWGSDPETLITLYKGLIRPRLDFAGTVFSRISKKMVAKLEWAQLIALKLCADFM